MTTMMNDARAAYMGNSVSTADPAQLLVLLCDRLVLDVRRALVAQQQERHDDARRELVHAQEIVMELRSSLDVDGFAGARELAAVYDYVHHRLVLANIHRDSAVTEECESLVTTIADTWRQAALSLARTA
jgi:flagellar secretion chaperone FliS